MNGKTIWYIVDGYRPPVQPVPEFSYEGHESVMILNTNSSDAHATIDIYFEDRDPIEGIPLVVPAKRVVSFRSSDSEKFGGYTLGINQQYSLRISSDVGIIVQYGRLDVQQPNMSYLATMGYAE